MPIKGLTDELQLSRALPRIGKLRKGGEKQTRKRKDGSEYQIFGKDLDYFRVDFEDEYSNLASDFVALYGEQPREFQHVRFFVPDVADAFPTWYEQYDSKQTLLHRCDGEYQRLHYDPKTGQWTGSSDPLDPKRPCEAACINARKNGETAGCQRTGKLKVVLTDFTYQTGAYGYFEIVTHSIHDIINLHNGLSFLHMNFGTLIGIEFVLGRTERLISTPLGRDKATGDIKRGKTKKSLLYIRPSNDFVKTKLLAAPEPELLPANADRRALLGPGETRRVPTGIETVEGEVIEDEPEPDPEPPTPEPPTGTAVPEAPASALSETAPNGGEPSKRQQVFDAMTAKQQHSFGGFETYSSFAYNEAKRDPALTSMTIPALKAEILARWAAKEAVEQESNTFDAIYADFKKSFASRAAFDGYVHELVRAKEFSATDKKVKIQLAISRALGQRGVSPSQGMIDFAGEDDEPEIDVPDPDPTPKLKRMDAAYEQVADLFDNRLDFDAWVSDDDNIKISTLMTADAVATVVREKLTDALPKASGE